MKQLYAGVFVLLLFAVTPLSAQRPIELGVDAGLTFVLTEPRVTSFSIPVNRVRAGFFISDAASLEPSVSLTHSRFDGRGTTILVGDLGLLWHFTPGAGVPTPYVRPFAGIVSLSQRGNGGTGASLGFGAGYKGALAERLQWRVEANLRRQFESDRVDERTDLGGSLGISFFTR